MSTVIELCKRLDSVDRGWNNRSLAEHRYPILLVDALGRRSREDGRVRFRATMIVGGMSEEGVREILGLVPGNIESEAGWREFFAWLMHRGLRGVDVAVSDRYRGLVKALQTEFWGCTEGVARHS